MHLTSKQSDTLGELAVKCRSLTEILLEGLEPAGEPFAVNQSADLFAGLPGTRLLLIRDGQVNCRTHNKLTGFFETGDLLGLPRSLNLPEGQYGCESPVTLIPYDRNSLVAHVNAQDKRQKNWAHYLLCQTSFYQQALASEMRSEFQPTAGFMHFRAGETIIHQGSVADRVYTLLEGSADALCDGIKVGEIHADEIFGALAVFTRQRRIASVVATSDCTVLAVRKEEFIDLIDHQPQICVGLIEEMAAKINQLNNQVLALAEKS